jgi:hypothetical protein
MTTRRGFAVPVALALALASGCGGTNWTSSAGSKTVGAPAPSGALEASSDHAPTTTARPVQRPASAQHPSPTTRATEKPTSAATTPTTGHASTPTTAPEGGTVSIEGIDPGITSIRDAGLEWVVYNDPSGVALSHPRSWTIHATPVGPVVISIDGDGTDASRYRRTVNLLEQPLADGLTATDYLDYTLAQISESGGVVENSTAIALDGVAGRATTWHAALGAVTHRFLSVWAVRGQLAFLVTYSSDAGHFAAPLADVKRLIASIRLPPVS